VGVLLQTARGLGIAPVDVELLSPLPLNECASQLRAAVSPFNSLLVAGPVFGEVTGTRLRARKHVVRRAQFQAHLVADLVDNGGQTSIRCRFTIRWWELCVFPVWIALVVFLWFRSPDNEAALVLPIMLMGGLSVFCLMLYLASEERRFLLAFLKNVVGAREVQQSVGA
jgi:hypothetical protein